MKNNIFRKKVSDLFRFFSRLTISAIFISAIPGKINSFERTVEYISSKSIPLPISSILLVGAIICLILSSGFFIFVENQKIGSVFFITTSYPNNNNFSCIPFPSKNSIYESRIDRRINYCCTEGTKINNLIKETQIFIYFLFLNSGKQFAI